MSFINADRFFGKVLIDINFIFSLIAVVIGNGFVCKSITFQNMATKLRW